MLPTTRSPTSLNEASRRLGWTVHQIEDEFSNSKEMLEWEQCVPSGFVWLKARFLRCARLIQLHDYRLEPLRVVSPNGDLAGVAVSYRSTLDAAELGGEVLQSGIRAMRWLAPELLRFQVVELGLPLGVGLPAHARDAQDSVLQCLASWAIQQARNTPNGLVIVRDIDPIAAPRAVAQLSELGFRPTPLPQNFVLSLPFSSFDEYKFRMRSSYRRRLALCMKATADLRCEVLSTFDHLAAELGTLWMSLYQRITRYRRATVTKAFFEAVSGLEESRLLLLRRSDESIAAFGLVYLDGSVLRYSSTGFTREAAHDEGVYFRLLYELVRFGIEEKCRGLSFGQSTAEPKMAVGALPVPLQAWIWHPSRLRREALSWLGHNVLKPPTLPSARNVFRDGLPPFMDPTLAERRLQVASPEITTSA